MTTKQFYHAGCLICRAEQQFVGAPWLEQYGEGFRATRKRLQKRKNLRKSVPLVTTCRFINYGIAKVCAKLSGGPALPKHRYATALTASPRGGSCRHAWCAIGVRALICITETEQMF
jgi:hypothetical protein